MSDNATGKSPISLNDLLSADKDRFDTLFSRQMSDTRLQTRYQLQASFPAASPQPTPFSELGAATIASLNEQLGDQWSYDIIDTATTSNEACITLQITAQNQTYRAEGRAALLDDLSISFQSAADQAARHCLNQIPSGLEITTIAQEAVAEKPVVSNQVTPQTTATVLSIDLLECSFDAIRSEMLALIQREKRSPALSDLAADGPMIANANGLMLSGVTGSCIPQLLAKKNFDMAPGDIILQSDPYEISGAPNLSNEWLVLSPVFDNQNLIGFVSVVGQMLDVGSSEPGSKPATATSIFGEGLRIPALKVCERNKLNHPVLDVLLSNTRHPDINRNDLLALIAACQLGVERVLEISERFGAAAFKKNCTALLERSKSAMRALIVENLPEEPYSFEDQIDEDAFGNGPFRLTLTVWREGDKAYFDWTGSSSQAAGPVNYMLHEGLFKSLIGMQMIHAVDPEFVLNDGFHDLIQVNIPKGSILRPEFPAPLGGPPHTLARIIDVVNGALSRSAPNQATAAGYGTYPYFVYHGVDGQSNVFQMTEALPGGIAGRPSGDGLDGHSAWPNIKAGATETLENLYPVIVENYQSIMNSGGAGQNRGGNGVEKVYRFLAAGTISVHDDRHVSEPSGILGGQPGTRSEKWIIKGSDAPLSLSAKTDTIAVDVGDCIIFRTAGGGGWGSPLDRDPNQVRLDVVRRLVSLETARETYGVVLSGRSLQIDMPATRDLRSEMNRSRHLQDT